MPKSVPIFGKSFELPDDIAEEIIQLRDAQKAEKRGDLDQFEQRIKQLEENLARDAESKAEAKFNEKLEALKAENNVDEIKKMIEEEKQREIESLKKQYDEKFEHITSEKTTLENRLLDDTIQKSFYSVDGFVKDAVDDVMTIYKSRYKVTPDGEVFKKEDNTPILGDDGKPLRVDQHAQSFLAERPQYLQAKPTPATGMNADASSRNGTVTMDEYNTIMDKGGPDSIKLTEQLINKDVKIV